MSIDYIGKLKDIAKKINPISQAKEAIYKLKATHFATRAAAFAQKEPETLMIFFDPKTDVCYMSHNQVHAAMGLREGKKVGIIKKALEFNATTQDNSEETLLLLGAITSGLDSIRLTRKENREREYKKIWIEKDGRKYRPIEYQQKLAKGGYFSRLTPEEKKEREEKKKKYWEDVKKKEEEKKRKREEDSIRKEQSKLEQQKVGDNEPSKE